MSALTHDDLERLTSILSAQAISAPASLGAGGYFRQLLQKSNLPPRQKNTRIAGLTGVPDFDAHELLIWADNQGGNRADPRYTTLGTLLAEALPGLGLKDAQGVVATILARELYRDPVLIARLQRDYNIPTLAETAPLPGQEERGATGPRVELGPDMDWRGAEDEQELQSFLKPEPDYQDVGFLMRAIQRAAGVCRITFEHNPHVGTGFIIGKNRVLTNFHVMATDPESPADPANELQANGLRARLQFGFVSTASGGEAAGQQFKLNPSQPVLKWSPVKSLDYALLQVEDSLCLHDELPIAPLSDQIPARGEALNILQHPGGTTLKLALSSDGIVTVIPDKGLVQYSTRAMQGSSGAPCFSDDWQVVALHHSQRSRSFGSVREGILIRNILQEIQSYLP